MNIDQSGAEDLVRDVLGAKAAEAVATLGVEDVARSAAARRHHSARRRVLLAAAAVVLVVGGPAAILLRPEAGTPGPAGSPTPTGPESTSPTPSPAKVGLDSVPLGDPPRVAFVRDGAVHEPDGSTTKLPDGADDVVGFTPYHGGWIVLDSVGGLTQYDNTGAIVRQGGQESALAVSADLMRTAYLLDGHVYVGISSGMGEGEVDHRVGVAGLAGFLGERVVCNTAHGAVAIDDAGHETAIPGLSAVDAISPAGDLVEGPIDDSGGIRVVSAADGRSLWTKPGWFGAQFSPDGRHLAAYRTSTGGEFESVAILDARNGKTVATSETPGIQALPAPPTAWEDASHLLIPYRGGSSWALLRLSADGAVSRATDVVTDESLDTAPFVFTALP
jgi:hypothetical protein